MNITEYIKKDLGFLKLGEGGTGRFGIPKLTFNLKFCFQDERKVVQGQKDAKSP